MLHDVGERLGDDEVGGELDRIRQAVLRAALDGHRQRCPSRERLDGGREAFVAEKRGVDSSGELAEFADRLLDLVLRAGQGVGCGSVGARGL